MKKNIKRVIILVILLSLLLFSLISTNEVITNILDYSKLFITKLFPVSFIFFIISNLLITYGLLEIIAYIFHINSSKLYVFFISMISGFPSGAKYTKDLLDNNYISVEDSNHIIMYSHFPNPLFVLGPVNLIIRGYSFKLLLSIILSNFIIFICKYKSTNKIPNNFNNNSFSSNLNNSINNAFQVLISIYGISLFFYLMAFLILKYISINSYFYILVNGLFDLTKGIFSTIIISNKLIRAYFILFFISFGSISIHMQVNSIINGTKISYNSFLLGRVISTILTFIIFIFIK